MVDSKFNILGFQNYFCVGNSVDRVHMNHGTWLGLVHDGLAAKGWSSELRHVAGSERSCSSWRF
jgi:hypothetical protein